MPKNKTFLEIVEAFRTNGYSVSVFTDIIPYAIFKGKGKIGKIVKDSYICFQNEQKYINWEEAELREINYDISKLFFEIENY